MRRMMIVPMTHVHGNTTSLWPTVPLGSHGVVFPTGLEEWFVNTTTASDDSNDSSASRVDDL